MMVLHTPFSIALHIASDVLVKGSVILAVAIAATWVLRRRSAAMRHLLWSVAFAVLLAIPVLSALLPSWRIGTMGLRPAAEVSAVTPPAMPPATPNALRPVHGELGAVAAKPRRAWADVTVVAAVALVIWLVGVVGILSRLGIDAVRVRGITKRSVGPTSSHLAATAARIARRLGMHRPVQVLVSDEVGIPATVGVWKPRVILPAEAASWPVDRARTVLMHELAHIVRWDYVVHFGVEAARAVYWLNPLVWLAARRLEMERERACDDQILRDGVGSAQYATTLLEMVRARALPSTALAMARGSGFQERIRSVMRRDLDRSPATRGWFSLFAMSALVVALPIATLEILQVEATRQTVAQLVDRLRDDDSVGRRRAAWALGEREDRRAVQPLIVGLQDASADVRLVAAWALGEIKDHGAIGPLMETLERDDDALVREMAALALGEIEDPAAVSALVAAFAERDELRGPVIWALGEMEGVEAAAARDRAFTEWRRVPWENDEVWVGRLDQEGTGSFTTDVAQLMERLRAPQPVARRSAAWNLGLLGDARAVDDLLDALRDPDAAVRAMAVWALDEINPSREAGR